MENKMSIIRSTLVLIVIILMLGAAGYYFMFYNPELQYPDRTEWAYEMIEATYLNSDGFYGEDVIVAIIDSGIDLSHPELEYYKEGNGKLIWKDYVSGNIEPYDDNGHGTAMAGLVAGRTYGVAPEVDLIVVKTISKSGNGKVEDIARAIHFAIQNEADVISLSLGGGTFPILGTEAERASEDAIAKGIFVIAAAGNDGESDNGDVDSPANVDLVIAAGAVDNNGNIAPFSSMGDNDGRTPFKFDDRVDPNKKPEVVAPGVEINVIWKNGKNAVSSGTSVATALVSGLIALTLDAHEVYQQENNFNENTIENFKQKLIESSAPPPGQASFVHDDHYGYGIIQGDKLNDKL